jgi:hypothetical protein
MTPIERIKKAIADGGHEPGKGQYVALVAGDVVAVAAGKGDDAAAAVLLKGASAVLADRVVYQLVDEVLRLIGE